MNCCFSELKLREVINVVNGERIGYIDDVKIDGATGKINSVIIYGRPRLFGVLGREDDVVIDCDRIEMIGSDTVLVRIDDDELCKINKTEKKGLFE